MIKIRNKIKFVIFALLFSIMLLGGIFAFRGNMQNADAEGLWGSAKNIGSIYNESTGKFDKTTFDKLAKTVGYSGMTEMVAAAEKGDRKTSRNFNEGIKNIDLVGRIAMQFGSYTTFFGSNEPLLWVPTYLSQTVSGEAILTLWLGHVENSKKVNGRIENYSNQNHSAWTDGTYSNTKTQNYHGSEIYCDSYDGSYLRNYVLNGNPDFASNWGEGSAKVTPDQSTMTKFTQFTDGEFSSYIVTPSEVGWQRDECYLPNDPKWDGNYEGATKANYPSEWLNDKLWLPSIYEMYNSNIAPNSLKASTTPYDGGLWDSLQSDRTVHIGNGNCEIFLRNARSYPNDAHRYLMGVDALASGYAVNYTVNSRHYIRPALHLNLTKILANVECNHVYGDWKITKDATCTEEGERVRTCLNDGAHIEKETIPALGHNFNTEYTIDANPTCVSQGIKSRHCSRCSKQTDVTFIEKLGHDWGVGWIIDENSTCTTNGKKHRQCYREGCVVGSEEEIIPAVPHEYGEPVWTWTDEYRRVTAKLTCTMCGGERVLKGEITRSTDNATCTVAGDITYTAKVTFNGKEYTDTQNVTSQTLPHDGELVSTITGPTCTTDGEGNFKCKDCALEYVDKIFALGHEFGEWEVTKKATYTEEGERRRTCTRSGCGEAETEAVPVLAAQTNEIEIVLSITIQYGDEIKPEITVKYGNAELTWYDLKTGEQLEGPPTTVGKYKLVVTVAGNEEEGYVGATSEVIFTIVARVIKVKINIGSSEAGGDLEELSAELTEGSIIGDDNPYVLTTRADTSKIGTYAIKGKSTDNNYEITFVDNVYLVTKKIEDSSGSDSGSVGLPEDLDLTLKITEEPSTDDFSDLKGINIGYNIHLWYGGGEDSGKEYTGDKPSKITLKIPSVIVKAISGDEEPDAEKIKLILKIYVIIDGEYVLLDDFDVEKDDGGNWVVNINYTYKYGTKIVLNSVKTDPHVVIDTDTDGEDGDDKTDGEGGNGGNVNVTIGSGGVDGKIDLPAKINVNLNIIKKPSGSYTDLNGVSIGYIIKLIKPTDGEGGEGEGQGEESEFKEPTSSTITLVIPIEIIITICGSEDADPELIKQYLNIYIIINGTYKHIYDFEITEGDDGKYVIVFNYSGTLPKEIVFNTSHEFTLTLKDPSGNGEMTINVNKDVNLTITQTPTTTDYTNITGTNVGYKVQLWNNGGGSGGESGGDAGDDSDKEFTEPLNCVITIKIPISIIVLICGDNATESKIKIGLKIYIIVNGECVLEEEYDLGQDEGGNWTATFDYDDDFATEVVFNTAKTASTELTGGTVGENSGGESGGSGNKSDDNKGLIIGLSVGGAALAAIVTISIVVAIKKKGGEDDDFDDYDDFDEDDDLDAEEFYAMGGSSDSREIRKTIRTSKKRR